MAANPIGAVVVAITALIAIFVTLYNKCEIGFRDGVNAIWEGIKKGVGGFIDKIKSLM